MSTWTPAFRQQHEALGAKSVEVDVTRFDLFALSKEFRFAAASESDSLMIVILDNYFFLCDLL